jgi:tetratricopeptide (TPR) repeat protein
MASALVRRPLYLCGGTQSSGSTLISWCFLQRDDTDGVLDARPDQLPQVPQELRAPLAWLKFTIASFRFSEVQAHLETEGWDVRPLLVVRDVRAVFNSLLRKEYGRNGITSDDPPIRLRLTRFLEDWKIFRQRGWPIICYERFVAQPDLLRETCQSLGLPWDQAMINWTKPVEQIADPNFGSPTFISSRKGSLLQTLNSSLAALDTQHVPLEDLQWMETTFADFNEVIGYPAHVDRSQQAVSGRAVPRVENTRFYERISKNLARTQQALAAAQNHYQSGRPLQAESLCRQVLNNVPDNLDALRLLARVAQLRGDLELSRLVQQLDDAAPRTASRLAAFGRVYLHLGQTEMAANAFRQALALRPDLMEIRQELSNLLKQTSGRHDPRPLQRDSA